MPEFCSFCGKRLDRYFDARRRELILECPGRYGLIGHDPRHSIFREKARS